MQQMHVKQDKHYIAKKIYKPEVNIFIEKKKKGGE